MKVVLDTNVVISALLTRQGICQRVLDYVFDQRGLWLSDQIQAEYDDVLHRPDFKFSSADIEGFSTKVDICGQRMDPTRAPYKTKDPQDQMFLDLAFSAGVDFLVTGNIKDYPTTTRLPFQIIKPTDFLKHLGL